MTGFVTDELVDKSGRRIGFDVARLGPNGVVTRRGVLARKQRPHEDKSTTWRKTGKYHVNVTSFEHVALPSLRVDKGCRVIVIDEIGRMELHSEVFEKRVRALLDCEGVRIVGALTAPIYGHRVPLCDEIAKREDVSVIKIKKSTRDEASKGMLRTVDALISDLE